MSEDWRPDVLGAPYESRTLPLTPDSEGPAVATLVRRLVPGGEARGAVLHVHGFADYFFQTGLAQWWVDRGWDFYAVDLRAYGRSWLPHQTPTYVADLRTYDEDLDAAVAVIGDDRPLVLSGHSTGGLVVPLWWRRRPALPVIGCVLNSPWLELRGPSWQRTVGTRLIDVVGRVDPRRVLEREVSGNYARSLHRDHDGEWDFDLTWKPLDSFPTRFGWLRAIRRAHAELHRGLDLAAPVLVLGSDRTGSDVVMGPEVFETDVVLDVEQIRRWTPALGRHVTLAQVPGAMHDVYLSRAPGRDHVYAELDRWVGAYVDR
ncbi:hypothetical protein GCM10011519_04380 [Marmoricola endophyticus]|uniref:Serine aminopeptidase S33 domain-containing protein n=1 Tax=Marmoricola endophyticus TaxID=2040280 RepID=A0A917BCH2_9ACTN|nr:alpha/beta hydrolase [Marmoricola endophyticus]GGF34019.1 hypothetical protein GCM10011519_04380 [Marmoricola endophyticus]